MDQNSLQQVFANLVQRLGDTGAKYGPQALDLMGSYMHWMGIAHLFIGFILAVITAFLLRFCWLCVPKCFYTDYKGSYEPTMYLPIIVGLVIVSIIIGSCACVNLFDSSNWVAAISPKLALVQLAIDAVSSHH